MDIGERIKFCRKHRGMTQDRLAEETGIHPVSIRKYETGKMVPKPEQIERIAKALNVTYSAISGDYDVVFPVGRFPEVISLLMMLAGPKPVLFQAFAADCGGRRKERRAKD